MDRPPMVAAPHRSIDSQQAGTRSGEAPGATTIRAPRLSDGAAMRRIAVNSPGLEANSSYTYLLWCRDFSATSVVAEIDGEIAGFAIGYLRPQAPDVLFVWQHAVDHAYRRRGLGLSMLEHNLMGNAAAHGVSTPEATVSSDNAATLATLARRLGGEHVASEAVRINRFPGHARIRGPVPDHALKARASCGNRCGTSLREDRPW